MTNDIPEIKVGMTMNELKNYVAKNSNNLSETAKQSIFNYINDENVCGDRKVSNKGELQLLMNFINGTNNMPPADDEVRTRHIEKGTLLSEIRYLHGSVRIEESSVNSNEDDNVVVDNGRGVSYYKGNGTSSFRLDCYVDFNGDGTLDSREYVDGRSGSRVYRDKDLDGAFETKEVYDKTTKSWITYYRDDNDNWVRK